MAYPANANDSYAAGLAAARQGRHAEAIVQFERALAERPNDARVLFALGNTASAIGHDDAAESFFRRVLAQSPDRLEALVNLANLLRKRGKTAVTVALLKPALERNPAQAELWLTLGSALRESGDAATAEIFYRETLRLQPGNAAARGNLGDMLADRGGVDEALALYADALAHEPENAQARLNHAVLLLLKGDFDRGWRDYEYRLAIPERTIHADHGLPPWNGGVTEGLRLLVTAEQGIGDQIMFASPIGQLAERLSKGGGRLFLECEPRLAPLFARSFPNVLVHAAEMQRRGGRIQARYDWLSAYGGAHAAVAIGSLPRLMRTRLADFPAPLFYLAPDAHERETWTRWLHANATGPFIGLCWRSGSVGGLRNRQYAPLEAWAAFIAKLPGTPVSLQYDPQTDEIATLQRLSGRMILVPPGLDQKQEIERTASLISALDGTVSAPTSVSWIAAGLGLPTLKILYNNSWTAFGCAYEPFAPSARCMMPDNPGDWTDAFAKAAEELKTFPVRPA